MREECIVPSNIYTKKEEKKRERERDHQRQNRREETEKKSWYVEQLSFGRMYYDD